MVTDWFCYGVDGVFVKVQVHARVRHTREIETHTEVSTSAQQARDFAGMSCYYPQTTSVATAVTTGMLRYYQCQRCGRCYGYYWPPGRGTEKKTVIDGTGS